MEISSELLRLSVLGLAVYHAAFVCEAIRSGVNTVPLGQAEAARAIGLGFMPAARLIILPQAFRGAIVPLGNTLIALIKNSTVAAVGLVATESSSVMKSMIEFRADIVIPIFLTFAIGFVIIVIPVGLVTTLAYLRSWRWHDERINSLTPPGPESTSPNPDDQHRRRDHRVGRCGLDLLGLVGKGQMKPEQWDDFVQASTLRITCCPVWSTP